MKRFLILGPVAALAACGGPTSSPSRSPTATPTGTAAVAPMTVVATRSYRCADGTGLSIDWMSDRSLATLTAHGGPAVHLSSALPGAPLIGSDFIVRGGAGDDAVSVTLPRAQASTQCRVVKEGDAAKDASPRGGARPSGRRR